MASILIKVRDNSLTEPVIRKVQINNKNFLDFLDYLELYHGTKVVTDPNGILQAEVLDVNGEVIEPEVRGEVHMTVTTTVEERIGMWCNEVVEDFSDKIEKFMVKKVVRQAREDAETNVKFEKTVEEVE